MTTIDGFVVGGHWVKAGDYVFSERFKQRPIGKTFGSVRSFIPLRTASGPQWAESELEAKAIQQFAFQPYIYDIFTQPIIDMEENSTGRTYTPDILVQLSEAGAPPTRRFVIEVKRKEALGLLSEADRQRIGIGRRFAKAINAEFRILTEVEIETPYLANVQMLESHLSESPNIGWSELLQIVEQGPVIWGDAAKQLVAMNISRPDARTAIEMAIAFRVVNCDLSLPIGEHSILSKPEYVSHRARWQKDPFLMAVYRANDGATIAT
ncbi:MAG: hypothetical protein DDT25_00475 [Chloroflexi bacterium]|nr:hypothetical protein [Chloroflexota bacterium]